MFEVDALDAAFGAEIRGVDCARPIGDDTLGHLVELLHHNKLLVFRHQRFTPEAYLRFGGAWGRPHPHVLDHLRMPGFPAIMEIGNTQGKDRDDNVRNGAAFWHTDQSYEAEPASATMLYCLKAPAHGGETQIADMVAAYDTLSEEMRERIDGLQAVHLYGAASGVDGEAKAAWFRNDEQQQRVPAVTHALVRPHPVTGQRALYAVAGTPIAIEGMSREEGDALLAELKQHALQERFIYRHKYEPGDLAVYDTSLTLHSATPIDIADGAASERLMWWISVKGEPRVTHPVH
jgi:taurine dioxygenase